MMKSRSVQVVVMVILLAAFAGAGYWFGYANGNAAGTASQAAAVDKKAELAVKVAANVAAEKSSPARVLQDFLSGRRHPDADELDAWASHLSLPECLENLKKLQELPAGLPRDDILKAVIDAWAKKDPQGLLADSSYIAVPKMRDKGINSALERLGKTDPKTAMDWIIKNADNASTADVGKRLENAIGGYATVDPQGALNAVLALGEATPNDQQVKSKAIEGLADSLGDQGRYADAIAMFNQLPVGQLQTRALNSLVENWADAAPQDAAAYVASVNNPALAYALSQNLTDTWSQTDPFAAAKWALQMDQQLAQANGSTGQDSSSDTVLANTIDTWAKYDLNAAGQFLNQLPPSTTKDAAVVNFVSNAAKDDPVAALKWVAGMTDTNLQKTAFMSAARQWVKQDPAAFTQFMTTTTKLTDEQKQAVADALQKKSGN